MTQIDSVQDELRRNRREPHEDSRENTPEHEPEVWDETIAVFNPHLNHTPEPYPVVVSPSFEAQRFDVDEYLSNERAKDLLRFSTAGSVDDGKSTLIGRLLYDTQSVYDDQLSSIEGKGTTAPGVLDLALLTDGLRAEREQGITIDVAYRYFSTARRKFIIADTPGHEQYTRNMATGASTADVAIILVDARKGVLVQSRRHAFITALLGVRNVIVVVNKMDLVDYSQSVFDQVVGEFRSFFMAQEIPDIEKLRLHFVPASALAGDNVVHASTALPWYQGPTLLSLLETLPSSQLSPSAPFRFAVQRVVRPNLDFRGFAGQIASGTVHQGDKITVLPSGKQSSVKEIVTFDGNLEHALAPLSVTLTLEDEIDISRGDVIVATSAASTVVSKFEASLVWMDATPLDLSRRYVLKQMSRSVNALVRRVSAVIDLAQGTQAVAASGSALELNEIGSVQIEVLQPIVADLYTENRHTGSFVLIDPLSNLTVAAGMIHAFETHSTDVPRAFSPVTPQEKQSRYRHKGAHLIVQGSDDLVSALERSLFDSGAFVIRLDGEDQSAAKVVWRSGALALSHGGNAGPKLIVTTEEGSHEVTLPNGEAAEAVPFIVNELRQYGVLLEEGAL